MIICPKCKIDFEIGNENVEAIKKDGQSVGWQHRICPKETKKLKENTHE